MTFILKPFILKPFETTAETTDLAITATARREQNTLIISYALTGDLSRVILPFPSKDATRKDRLWKQTCFEFFLAEARSRSASYWEFNLSPSGDWNVFALRGYRQGLGEESAFSTLPFTVRCTATALHLAVTVDIGELIDSSQPLWLGISAVIIITEKESFWAIAHPAPEADFHHPDSFIIEL